MPATKSLTEDEVSALLESLAGATGGAPRGVLVDPQDVQPFSFDGDDLSLMSDLHALTAINERLGRQSRNIFQAFLRFQPRIAALPQEAKTLDEYIASLPSFVSLHTLRLEQLKGSALLTLRPEFISLLVSRYFGGDGTNAAARPSEFTPTEERVARLVTERLMAQMKTAWRDVMPLDITPVSHETNPAFVALCEGSDVILVSSFAVQIPDSDPFLFDICYTVQSLKPIIPVLRSKLRGSASEEDVAWREKLQEAVMNIALTLRPRIANPQVTAAQLLDLEPGMVVPIPAIEDVALYIDDTLFAHCTLGEVAGSTAVKIMSIVRE